MASNEEPKNPEQERLDEDARRGRNWKRWGPYLSERQWGTVREDYSADGSAWESFPHDHARSRAYRWGEDGLLGITDRECRLCLSVALWNGRDPILKERLYGLTGNEGNHGEDVKECYYYLDSTPTHSYMKALYKYPQQAFPYSALLDGTRERGRAMPELELADTGIFEGNRYFDVLAEYAKDSPEHLLGRFTLTNRGPEDADLHFLPTAWYRNTWAWGRTGESYWQKPHLRKSGETCVLGTHESLGTYGLMFEACEGVAPRLLFTENETNVERLYQAPTSTRHVKDAFHELIVQGRHEAVNPEGLGTKCAAWYRLRIPAGESRVVRLQLFSQAETPKKPFGPGFDDCFRQRIAEADVFYSFGRESLPAEQALVIRQANAGLLWSKQFYNYVVADWLEGDPASPPPPAERAIGRNRRGLNRAPWRSGQPGQSPRCNSFRHEARSGNVARFGA